MEKKFGRFKRKLWPSPRSGGALPSVRSVQDGDLAQAPLLEVYLLPTDRMERAGGGARVCGASGRVRVGCAWALKRLAEKNNNIELLGGLCLGE